jgi:hypothetical protein
MANPAFGSQGRDMADRDPIDFSAYRNRFPPEIAEYFYSIWEKREIWVLDLPRITLPVRKLAWQLDYPFWSIEPPKPRFDLRPRAVLERLDAYPRHRDRVRAAKLEFPLDVAQFGGRFVILDGLHRLLKAVLCGAADIECKLVPREYLRVSANSCRGLDRSIADNNKQDLQPGTVVAGVADAERNDGPCALLPFEYRLR